MRLLLAAVVGYCVGSVSFAVIVGRAAAGIDVRQYGSGTAGGANTGRLLGARYGILVALCDIAKGMAAALIGRMIGGAPGQMASGAAAVIGHILPLGFGFRGGKAIATFFGSCVLTAPLAVLPAGALWLALYIAFRSVARASAIASACLPLIGWVCRFPRQHILYLGVMGAAICLRHVPDARVHKPVPPRSGRSARRLMMLALALTLAPLMPTMLPTAAGAEMGESPVAGAAESGQPIWVRVGILGLSTPVKLGSSSAEATLCVADVLKTPVALFELDQDGAIVCVSADGARTSFEGPVAVEVVPRVASLCGAQPLIWVGSPSDVYRGRFELAQGSSPELCVVNILDLDDYVAGVAPYEIGLGAPQEALKAQAVVCRTEALWLSGRHSQEPFSMCSSTHCQVYRGASAELARPDVRRAVDSTRGEALFYDGRPAPGAKYHACCGGVTESAGAVWGFDVPYMRAVYCRPEAPEGSPATSGDGSLLAVIAAPDPQDFCYGSNGYRWRVEYTAAQLAKVLEPVVGSLESSGSRIMRVDVVQRTPRGSALRVKVTTTGGEFEIAGEYAIRMALGGTVTMKSGVFVVTSEGDPPTRFVFSGAGYGHGVGMCQYGARSMARAGYDYRAILTHYYPGATVESIMGPTGPLR